MDLKERISIIANRLEHDVRASFAALGMAKDDAGYCDFFVENGGDGKPFHEKCPTDVLAGISFKKAEFSNTRMTRLEKLGLKPMAADDYCDFFVENGGDGKPWHEKCSSLDTKLLLGDPAARGFALRRLSVMQAFTRAVDMAAIRR